jgi:hypothetical protein
MPETRLRQLIRRCQRQEWLTTDEGLALIAACEVSVVCTPSSDFIKLYGTRTAKVLEQMLEPIPEANGVPHGRQATEAPALGTAAH